MTDVELSCKCRVLSFWAMVAVVYIHSNTLATFPGAADWNVFVQKLLTRTLSSWAVPFFFCLSGYWFAAKSAKAKYGEILRKKVRGLLYPYLLWAVIGAAVSLPLFVFNNHVNHVPLLSRTFLADGFSWQAFDRLLGITTQGPSGNLALWYVRSLLVFFLTAPVWQWMFRRVRWTLWIVSVVLLVFEDLSIPFAAVKLSSLGWFLLGMALVDVARKERLLPLWGVGLVGILWAGAGVLTSAGKVFVPLQLMAAFGIIFTWSVYDYGSCCLRWAGSFALTFWTYCLHGALIGYFVSGATYVFGKSDASTLLACLVAPWIVICVCWACGKMTARLFPPVFGILNGGR